MAVSKKTTVNEAAQDETEQAPQTVAPKRRRAPAKRAEKEVATLETAGLKLSVEASEEAVAPKTKPVRRRTRKTAEAAEAALLPHPPLVRPNHSVFSGPADYRPGNHASREKQPVILAARRCIDYFSSYVSALRAVAA